MTPIAPLITQFLREHMPRDHGYSLHTCETYAHAFRLLFLFASERLRTPRKRPTKDVRSLVAGGRGFDRLEWRVSYREPRDQYR